MNNTRYCLHCQIFGETRQEMRIDSSHMKVTGVTMNGLEVHLWEAECPKCGSLEHFVTKVRKEPDEGLGLYNVLGER